LRALAERLEHAGGRLIAYETAGTQGLYPWQTDRRRESFEWITLFPDRVLEEIPTARCRQAMREALERDRPSALGAVGYVRPESLEMLRWGRARGCPTILMSESQQIDHPRLWWKEAVKRRRVRQFSSALVGGPRHLDYLVSLGMPAERIALGYNAVDEASFASQAASFRNDPEGRRGLPDRPYFLCVSRFAPEKNLSRLIRAFARYRAASPGDAAWDLVLCGDGPEAIAIEREVAQSGFEGSIHRPGFLQLPELARWYAFASAFVLASLSEPWGLVVNEAAACELPLLVSERAGCVDTFVPEGRETTGRRLDPLDIDSMAAAMHLTADLSEPERRRQGRTAAAIAHEWGPRRFAQGVIEALALADSRRKGNDSPQLTATAAS
jgi:glycosyltransferase involved in cell wall biosynthesis